MPELPEVENVRRSLEAQGAIGQTFDRVELLRANLRTPLKKELGKNLPGQTVQALNRRAKFLIFETEDFQVISHLGMTGSWRPGPSPREKHDHVIFQFRSGLQLVFNDPRRFGLLELVQKNQNSRWLDKLGPEPLSADFNADYLFAISRGLKAPIKNLIMDQRRVVGVGNIYASEALFRARVRPSRPAYKLTRHESQTLVQTVSEVLTQAISAGGSTIRDYRNAEGESGRFQNEFAVYGRAGEPCPSCKTPIKSKFLAGRNTFWCAKCQR